MSLPNGEQIKMSDGTCILMETTNLKNVTPATISRCGLIYLHKEESCNPKSMFNQWLKKLPPNLAEYSVEIDLTVSYLMNECMLVFEEESQAGTLLYDKLDQHWLVQNFLRLLNTMIFDYFVEYEKSNQADKINQGNPRELGKSLMNLSLGNTWVDKKPDPNMTLYPESDAPSED